MPEGNLPINLKLIKKYQRKEPSLKDKYKDGTHYKGSLCSGIIIYTNLIMCEDKIVITSILKSYVLHWYHKHIFHTGMIYNISNDLSKHLLAQHKRRRMEGSN